MLETLEGEKTKYKATLGSQMGLNIQPYKEIDCVPQLSALNSVLHVLFIYINVRFIVQIYFKHAPCLIYH